MAVDPQGADPAPAIEAIAGVTSVSAAIPDGDSVALEVQCDQGADVRRALARTVVSNGWGLLELTPLRMSLEDIFLELTTSEEPREDDAAAPDAAAPAGDGADEEAEAADA